MCEPCSAINHACQGSVLPAFPPCVNLLMNLPIIHQAGNWATGRKRSNTTTASWTSYEFAETWQMWVGVFGVRLLCCRICMFRRVACHLPQTPMPCTQALAYLHPTGMLEPLGGRQGGAVIEAVRYTLMVLHAKTRVNISVDPVRFRPITHVRPRICYYSGAS